MGFPRPQLLIFIIMPQAVDVALQGRFLLCLKLSLSGRRASRNNGHYLDIAILLSQHLATMTSSPWAKLTTLVALKMMTNPKATRL